MQTGNLQENYIGERGVDQSDMEDMEKLFYNTKNKIPSGTISDNLYSIVRRHVKCL